eukprot:6474301-Amphidinium_carterae.1
MGACKSLMDKTARSAGWATRVSLDCLFSAPKNLPDERVTTSPRSAVRMWSADVLRKAERVSKTGPTQNSRSSTANQTPLRPRLPLRSGRADPGYLPSTFWFTKNLAC